jgi:hypothetical protein
MLVQSLGRHYGWDDRAFFSAMTWFWWFYATIIATWTVAMYRYNQTLSRAARAAAVPMKPASRMLTALGTNLMLFWPVGSLAWWASDRQTAGIIAGVTLAMSAWQFVRSRGKTGPDIALSYIVQLALSCAAMLLIFNLRFDAWAATWYGVSVTEVQRLLPTQMVPLLTAVLAVWAMALLALTRSARSAK